MKGYKDDYKDVLRMYSNKYYSCESHSFALFGTLSDVVPYSTRYPNHCDRSDRYW